MWRRKEKELILTRQPKHVGPSLRLRNSRIDGEEWKRLPPHLPYSSASTGSADEMMEGKDERRGDDGYDEGYRTVAEDDQ